MRDRKKIRVGLKVIHRHKVGESTFRRVSELVYIDGRPKALLGWINVGGVRTPIYICELDPAKLRKSEGAKNTFFYDGITVDPRFDDLMPPARQSPPSHP
ncbi:MAG TPA: hypothetical protein VGC92_13285 [Phenylobacterium sp.]